MNPLTALEPFIREVANDVATAVVHEVQRRYDRPDITYWRTVSQFTEECPSFSRHRLMQEIASRERNGLDAIGAVKRDGGRWLIHLERFDTWWEGR